MIGVGSVFPAFKLAATVSIEKNLEKAFKTITNMDYQGKWKLFFLAEGFHLRMSDRDRGVR